MKLSPTMASIREIFESELHAANGTVADRFDDGQRLYLRGVLPTVGDVLSGDHIRGGVALRAVDEQVLIHPYTFRQVCSNGAIMAHALGTEAIERIEDSGLGCDGFETCEQIRQAVRACADPSVFEASLSQMRAAAHSTTDTIITLMPFLSRMPGHAAADLIRQITERLGPDRSRFGLMNAVTSTARDTSDPELRWRLEELGGAVAAGLTRSAQTGPAKMALSSR